MLCITTVLESTAVVFSLEICLINTFETQYKLYSSSKLTYGEVASSEYKLDSKHPCYDVANIAYSYRLKLHYAKIEKLETSFYHFRKEIS